jgi:multisubunit Na+/H+ antiporter MnhB subunit
MLAEIEDYANDSAYRYEMRNLDRIRDQIESGIQRIQKHRDDQQDLTGANNNPSNDVAIDDSADELRAALVDLYEHLAGYQREWAHGSALIRALVTCGSTSVLMLTAMGTLPWYYFQVRMPLEMYNWALLGAAGSITSLLLSYYKYRIVEIGNTEGKQELLRAALAATLGTIAGLITYAIAWFGVIDGPIIPVVYSPDPKHIAGSIAAAIGAGFVFESVFERLKLKSQDVYGQ